MQIFQSKYKLLNFSKPSQSKRKVKFCQYLFVSGNASKQSFIDIYKDKEIFITLKKKKYNILQKKSIDKKRHLITLENIEGLREDLFSMSRHQLEEEWWSHQLQQEK